MGPGNGRWFSSDGGSVLVVRFDDNLQDGFQEAICRLEAGKSFKSNCDSARKYKLKLNGNVVKMHKG